MRRSAESPAVADLPAGARGRAAASLRHDERVDPMQARRAGGLVPSRFPTYHQRIGDTDGSPDRVDTPPLVDRFASCATTGPAPGAPSAEWLDASRGRRADRGSPEARVDLDD